MSSRESNHGYILYFYVLNAEQPLSAVQRDWHKARAETLVQGMRLKAANATLEEADLRAINDLLEMEQP